MVLEFDCEVALLQTAFQEIQRQHGNLEVCGFPVVLKSLPIFNEAVSDIEQNRREDSISLEVIAHRDRKLVAGVFYSVLRLKVGLSSNQNEFFEALDDVYPNFDWPLLLGLIAVGRWHDHILECLESVHPAVFGYIVHEILPLIGDTKHTFHVPVLVRILSLLMCPSKARELTEISNKTVTSPNGKVLLAPAYEDLVNKVFDLIVKHLLVQQSWAGAVSYDFLLALFQRLCKMLRSSWKVFSVNFSNVNINPEMCSKIINAENIMTVHAEVFKFDSCNAEEIHEDGDVVPVLHLQVRYAELCYETLTSLHWKEFLKSRPYLKLLSSDNRRRRMTELKSCFIELNEICRTLLQQKMCDASELLATLNLVYQQLTPYCQIFDELGCPTQNIVKTIDERDTNYNDCVNSIVTHPGLQDNKEWLSCLLRNAELLDHNHVHCILSKLQNRNFPESEQLKQIILKSFTSWPSILQQDFQLEYLQNYSSGNILKTNDFSKDLTITFNQVVHTDIEDKVLRMQLACLCLQSAQDTLLQTVLQAIKNSVQMNLAIQVLSSVSYVCQHRKCLNGPTVLDDVLKDVVSNHCQTEVQTQNMKELVSHLLQTSMVSGLDVFCNCVLPFLDKWDPDDNSEELLLALGLLQIVLEFEQTVPSKTCISKIQPCVLLMYLGNIIFQCKIMCEGPNMMWVQVKTTALNIVKILISTILCSPTYVSEKELTWLHGKLQKIDDTISFYFLDLFECYNMDLDYRNALYPMELLLEFACCNSNCTSIVEPWLTQLIANMKHGTEAQLIAALCKVLPSSLAEEWKNVFSVLEFIASCEKSPLIVATVSSFLPAEAKVIVETVYLLCQALTCCNAAGKDTRHMVHCLNLVIQEKLQSCESSWKKPETVMPMLTAEVSVEICRLLRKLPPASAQEGGVLLMALSQMCLKSTSQPNKNALKVIYAGISRLPSSDLKKNLLKTFSCFSPVAV